MTNGGVSQWIDISNKFNSGGRNTQYEKLTVLYNKYLKIMIVGIQAGVTGNNRSWSNGEIRYYTTCIKSYEHRMRLTGQMCQYPGSYSYNETVGLNASGGVNGDPNHWIFEVLDSQGGSFHECILTEIFFGVEVEYGE